LRVIDTARAQRAREIYDAALCQPVEIVPPLSDDELVELDAQFNGYDCGVKYSNKPHEDSAYAHLPMRGIAHSKSSTRPNSNGVGGCYVDMPALFQKRSAIALWPKLNTKTQKFVAPTLIKANAAHPGAYHSDLPLRGLGLAGENPVRKWTLTATEKRELAARPLHYVSAERIVTLT